MCSHALLVLPFGLWLVHLERFGPELRALLDGRLALAVNYLSAVLVLAIVALMVFKPGSSAG